jgi:hypothetical protein
MDLEHQIVEEFRKAAKTAARTLATVPTPIKNRGAFTSCRRSSATKATSFWLRTLRTLRWERAMDFPPLCSIG